MLGYFHLKKPKWFRFSDESMEIEYQKQLGDIDTKLFLVFSIFLCIITTFDFVLSLTKPSEGRNLVSLIFQVALPITALILQKYTPVLSRVVFVAAALLFLSMLFHDFIYFYSGGVPSQYFYIGNVIGLCEVVIMTNIQSLFYKLFLGVAILLQKLLIMRDGFLYTTANLIGILIVSILIMISFFYQEVMNRGRFKLGYESQERLKKFQSLLSDDLPISVLIVTADFLSVQFSNTLFDLNFKERNDQQISLDSLFEKFELDIDPKSLGLTNNNRITLIDFVKSLQLNHNNLKDRNLMVLPAIYRNSRVPLLCKPAQHYEIKVRKIKWDTISSYAFIFNDVSEKHLVTALKLANEQKNRLIATVSHELRTPINGTLGLLGLLESRINDEMSKSYIQHCKNCNKLLLYLVNSILDLSKLRDNTLRISKETFSLDSILDEIKCLYQYQCQQKGIAFSVIRNQHAPKEIFTDKYKLMEVLIHLVGNAVKFTFHGSVLLEVRISDDDKDVLEFTVRDTGIGIKDEDKPGLLQMFEDVSINNHNINTSGAGLGLAVVTGLLAALNNGFQENLWFESQYGRGTIFSFRIMNYHSERLISLATPNESSESEMVFNCEFLKECKIREEVPIERIISHESISQINNLGQLPKPIKQEKTDEYQLLHTEEESVHLNNVLVVDDNPLNILAASFLLEKIKCKVEKAFNGQECIEELERSFRQNKFYDLILMDIQMPVMDGPQASKIIGEKIKKGELAYVPIIALTAKKSTEEEKLYYSECGIKTVLEKPLNTNKLLEAIGKFVK